MFAELIIFLFGAAILYYKHYNNNQKKIRHYTDQGIPLVGSLPHWVDMIFKSEHFTENMTRRYKQVKKSNQKFGLELEFGVPSLFITDLDLINQITTKYFDHFTDPRKFVSLKSSSYDLVGRMLFAIGGSDWKAVRSKLSPTFTTAKIKRMFPVMNSVGEKLVSYLKKELASGTDVVNLEDGISKLTLDFISSVAFGWDTKVFEKQTSSDQFLKMAAKLSMKIHRVVITFVAFALWPTLASFLKLSIFEIQAQEYFRGIISNTITERKVNPENKRHDFIELMLEIRDAELNNGKSMKTAMDVDEITAHSMTFISGGFDTLQNALLMVLYNLSVWPNVQERVYQELQEALKESNGAEFTPEIINGLHYLEKVLQESLRIHPIASGAMRTCTKDFQIPGTSILVQKGTLVQIPIFALHHDPEYFPNPEIFDPERFSTENKSSIHPSSYIPFSLGPRACIGMRLAQLVTKTTVAHLMWNFVLEKCDRTSVPIKLSKSSIIIQPDGGVWLKLKPRNKNNN